MLWILGLNTSWTFFLLLIWVSQPDFPSSLTRVWQAPRTAQTYRLKPLIGRGCCDGWNPYWLKATSWVAYFMMNVFVQEEHLVNIISPSWTSTCKSILVYSRWYHIRNTKKDLLMTFLAFLGKIKIELLKGLKGTFLVGLHQGVGGSPLWLLKY